MSALSCRSAPQEIRPLATPPGSARPDLSLLGKVQGAEKTFLAARRDRAKDLESSVTFFLVRSL